MTVRDTIQTKKTLQPSEKVVESLLKLRDELWSKRKDLDHGARNVVFKINSCLYAKYPIGPESGG